MSWATYKNTISSVLTDNDYREIPENKLPENTATAFNHQSYLLKGIGTSDVIETTSNGIQYAFLVDLQIKYTNVNSDERHVNFDSFLNVFKAIATLADYKGTTQVPRFEDIDEKHTKGSFQFLFGEEIEC